MRAVPVIVSVTGVSPCARIEINGCAPVLFKMPATFTGTQLLFEHSIDGNNWQPLYRAGVQVALDIAQGRDQIASGMSDLRGLKFIRFYSNASEGAARSITVLVAEG